MLQIALGTKYKCIFNLPKYYHAYYLAICYAAPKRNARIFYGKNEVGLLF